MNGLKLALFLMVAITFAACDKDDDDNNTCTQADWVGTYTGTLECDGEMEDVTFTIAASGTEALTISYQTATVTLEFTEGLTPSNCELDFTASDSGITITVDAELDGNTITYEETTAFGTDNVVCKIEATRQ